MMFEALKLPVLIVSTPRSGSTALAFEIYEHFKALDSDVVILSEPKNSTMSEEDFIHQLTNKKMILKIHAHDLPTYPMTLQDMVRSGHFSIVRIRRKSFLDQCVSNYIGLKTGIWFTDVMKNEMMQSTVIELDFNLMQSVIRYRMPQYNKIVDNFAEPIALDLFYEDCKFSSNTVLKNERVANYNEIKTSMNEILTMLKRGT